MLASISGRKNGYQRLVEGKPHRFRFRCLLLTACISLCSGYLSFNQLLAAHGLSSPSLEQLALGHSFESGPVSRSFTVGVDARSVSQI